MSGREQFGQIAVKLGYVTAEQVQEGLKIQQDLRQQGEESKLLGMILLELGYLSTTRLINILQYYKAGEDSTHSSAPST